MTVRLFYEDPFLLEFDARVMAVERDGARLVTVLERTAFYPTSGGQLHDLGQINGVPVIDVVELDEGTIGHVTERPVASAGETVHGQVDRRRRLQHCRQHTVQHILSQVFIRLCGYETVSVHLGEEYGAIELKTGKVTDDELSKAERLANEIIHENRPVTISQVSREEAERLPLRKMPPEMDSIRVVTVEGLDWSACGGTHCRNTAEVGFVKLVGTGRMRGHVMVKFLCGTQALEDYTIRYQVTNELGRRLTCHVTELPHKVETLDGQVRDLRRDLSDAWRDLLPVRAEAAAERARAGQDTGVCIVEEEVPDQKLAGELVGMVADRVSAVALMAYEGRLLLATPSDSELHAGDLARRLAEEAGLSGGGSPRLAQLGGPDRDKLQQYRRCVEQLLADA